MFSDHPSQVRELLRSGCVVEIGGGRAQPRSNQPARILSRTQITLGFAAIYLI
jgi:hypothetical protein